MNFSDLILRIPQIAALVIGLVMAGVMMRRYPVPSILAASGLLLNLFHVVLGRQIGSFIGGMLSDPEVSLRASNLVHSSLSATYLTFYVLAMFVGRRWTLRNVDVPQEQVSYALSQISAGQSYSQIETSLAQQGLPTPLISLVMNEVENQASKEIQKAGLRTLIVGCGLFALGLAVSIGSYLMAANAPGGGRYMVTHGLIVVGAIQIVRGLIQLTK